eukprot:SAG31_NODE_15218_length_764_cov_31.720301_1_plen_103_part_00
MPPKKGSRSAKPKARRKPATAEVPASAVKSPRGDKDNAEETDDVVQPTAAAGLDSFELSEDSDKSDSDESLTSDAEEPPSKKAAPMSAEVMSILPPASLPST